HIEVVEELVKDAPKLPLLGVRWDNKHGFTLSAGEGVLWQSPKMDGHLFYALQQVAEGDNALLYCEALTRKEKGKGRRHERGQRKRVEGLIKKGRLNAEIRELVTKDDGTPLSIDYIQKIRKDLAESAQAQQNNP